MATCSSMSNLSRSRVIVETPCEFLDGEDWGFDLNFTDPETGLPLDLTGSRLYVSFVAGVDSAPVGVCDSAASDGTLSIPAPALGRASFLIPVAGRSWVVPPLSVGMLRMPATVVGDIYRRVGSSDWAGLARATIFVLPTSGKPSS